MHEPQTCGDVDAMELEQAGLYRQQASYVRVDCIILTAWLVTKYATPAGVVGGNDLTKDD